MTLHLPATLILAADLAALVPSASGWLCRMSGEVHASRCCGEVAEPALALTGDPCCELTASEPRATAPALQGPVPPAPALPVSGAVVTVPATVTVAPALEAAPAHATGPPIRLRTCISLT